MTLHTPELLRQNEAHKAIQARLWGKKEKPAPSIKKIVESVCRPPSDFSYHVHLFRKWHRDMLKYQVTASFVIESQTKYRPYSQEIKFDFIKSSRKSMEQIASEVLWDFPNVKLKDIRGSRRTKVFILPRQLAMYEIKTQRPDLSYPMIGKWFGGRDHTTVLHAVRKIEAEKAAS